MEHWQGMGGSLLRGQAGEGQQWPSRLSRMLYPILPSAAVRMETRVGLRTECQFPFHFMGLLALDFLKWLCY